MVGDGAARRVGACRARDGAGAVGKQVEENPLLALLVAGAVGYGLALLIHGKS